MTLNNPQRIGSELPTRSAPHASLIGEAVVEPALHHSIKRRFLREKCAISDPSDHHASTSSVRAVPIRRDTSDNPGAHAPIHPVSIHSDARVVPNANTLATTSNRGALRVHAHSEAAVVRH